MGKITKIISKNLKFLLRSKISSLIVIYGPLLVIFLLGVAFDNSNLTGVKVGVYSDSYSDLTESFIAKIQETTFNAAKMTSEEFCKNQVAKGVLQLCIVFPPDMGVSNDQVNEIIFYVDYSKMNLVYLILDNVNAKVENQRREVSLDLTTVAMDKLKETQDALAKNQMLVQEISSLNSQTGNEAQDVSNTVDKIDLDVDIHAFGADDLRANIQTLPGKVDTLKSKADSEIMAVKARIDTIDQLNQGLKDVTLDAREIISNAQEDIDDYANSSSQLSGVSDDLNEAEHLLNVIVTRIDNNYSNAMRYTSEGEFNNYVESVKGDIDTVDNLVISLQKKLSDLDDKMKAGTELKVQSITKVATLKESISTTEAKLTSLYEAMNDIDNNINSITVDNPENIVNPFITKVQPVLSENTHLNYMFPGLIVLIIMFVTILLSSTIVGLEKSSKAQTRNTLSPTGDLVFVVANYFTNILLILVQLVVIIAIAVIFFKAVILSSLIYGSVVLLLISTFFILLGMLVGHIFNSDETTTLASVIIASIMLIMSGLILPLENMSEMVMKVAQYNPFVVSEFLLKQTMLFNANIGDVLTQFVTLVVMCIAMFVVILIVLKVNKALEFNYKPSQHKKKKSKKPKQKGHGTKPDLNERDKRKKKRKNVAEIAELEVLKDDLKKLKS